MKNDNLEIDANLIEKDEINQIETNPCKADDLELAAVMKNCFYKEHDRRGIAIIFNHRTFHNDRLLERAGTQKDGDDLKTVLKELQFEVREYRDKNLNEIRNILYKVSLEDHSNNDCLWVTVMSHGGTGSKISSSDIDYPIEELWQNFVGNRCESLVGKPKLFSIQACRGSEHDYGVECKALVQSDAQLMVQTVLIPQMADLLVMYSSADDYTSNRHSVEGSWFIQALCGELKAKSTKDLFTILTAVTRRVAFGMEANLAINKCQILKQVPCLVSMLTKTMFFTPKKM